ncbi:MAG: iron-sulfur cluster assembly scaffold protein [Alphaproteobacteria bacterium]|nr:iron-sulfur cluster assembly scaffold protein [Alphaproteobacteria bacterium]
MFGDLYHNRILELAADIPHSGRLQAPHGSSVKVSRICGSSVGVDVRLGVDRRVVDIGVEPRACALGQAAASILARQAIGKSLDELQAAREGLRALLKDGAPAPEGDFWELRHLAPVRDYPPRHASTLLAFDAVVEAMERAIADLGPGSV